VSPEDIVVRWPDAGEIGKAVFVAAALEGVDAIEVIQGGPALRARAYAFLALAHEFPTVPRATLGRKCGNDRTAPAVRAALTRGSWPWFDLGRLNAVRAACGWSDMTMREATDAPLLYCGRSFTEFLPDPIQSSVCGGDLSSLIGSPAEKGALAGGCVEKAPATLHSSDGGVERHAEATSDGEQAGKPGSFGGRVRSGDLKRGDCKLIADRCTASEGQAKTVLAGIEPGPSDASFDPDAEAAAMLERVARRKAWLAGEQPDVAEVEAAPVVKTASDSDPVAIEPVSENPPSEVVEKQDAEVAAPPLPEPQNSAVAAQSTPDAPQSTPEPEPAPAPRPLTPSPAAAALAEATRAMRASKASLRPASTGAIGAHVRRVTQDKPPAPGERKPIPEGNELADARRPRDEFRTFRAAELGRGVVSYRRADPPAEKRGMVNVTSDLMGDRPANRLRTDQIDAGLSQ
jgi:hypothetical protein